MTALLPKRKSVVGVDLGHAWIKVAQVDRAGTGYKVVRFGSVPTPKDAIKDGMVVDPDAVGAALREALREAHIHAGLGIVAAAGGAVYVRGVSYPKMAPGLLRESLKFEASRYIPGSVEDSYVEAEILPPDPEAPDETNMRLMLVAAPKDLVASRIAACERAGLEVHEVDLESFASFRATIETDPLREIGDQTIAFLDFGAVKTSVSIVRNGAFVMHRTLGNGGRALTESLMSYFSLEEDDAESGKAVLDVGDLLEAQPEDNPPLRVLQPQLDDLVRELKRSLNYYQTQSTGGPEGAAPDAAPPKVDGMVLCGGGARLKGVDRYLEAKIGLPCGAVGVYDNPSITHNGVHEDAGLDLTVACGLALRPLVAMNAKANFKPAPKATPPRRAFGRKAA